MTETYKIVNNQLEITDQAETVVTKKTYEELEAALKQAQDSLVQVKARHAEEEKAIQDTIDLMAERFKQATDGGVKATIMDEKIV